MARIVTVFNQEEVNATQFPIIVENWDKKNFGKGKRIFRENFKTEPEKDKLRKLYRDFYQWYLVRGTPKEICWTVQTYEFVKRAVSVFAQM